MNEELCPEGHVLSIDGVCSRDGYRKPVDEVPAEEAEESAPAESEAEVEAPAEEAPADEVLEVGDTVVLSDEDIAENPVLADAGLVAGDEGVVVDAPEGEAASI